MSHVPVFTQEFYSSVTRLDRRFNNPAVEDSKEKRLGESRRVRDELRSYLKSFLKL